MKDLVRLMAQALVDNPKKVSVSEIKGNQTSVIKLKVDKADTGKAIGKYGRNVEAMRTILNAASGKKKTRTILEIVE